MASTDPTRFSLRPWPIGDKKPKTLNEFVTRVNFERHGFYNVTEDKLHEEISAQEQDAMRIEDEGLASPSESEDEADGEKSKSVIVAREEFLRNLDSAHQHTMMTLDFVSLLLSKEIPNQAGNSLSPALRDMAGIGTLGASKLKDSNLTEARIEDDLAVATGWRLMEIDKMVDSAMAAAEKLEREIALETRYWADVLAVSENRWAVCPLPHEPQTLGVRFGFSEAAPEFRNNSIAPLRRNDDGTARLATGRIGGGSQRLRVTLLSHDEAVGRSSLPRRLADDAPLQDRVLEARNTVRSQELWYEINREARTLLALGVHAEEASVTWELDARMKVVFTLEVLSDTASGGSPAESHPYDWLAQSILVTLHLLLSYAHRRTYSRRTYPQVLAANRASQRQPWPMLRSLIARAKHTNATFRLVSFLERLVSLLHRAGITTAAYRKTTPPITSGLHNNLRAQGRPASLTDSVFNKMIYAMDLGFEVTVTPEARFQIQGGTSQGPYIGHRFGVFLRPATQHGTQNRRNSIKANGNGNGNIPNNQFGSTAGQDATMTTEQEQPQEQQQKPNLLEWAYPPAADPYHDATGVMTYLRNATARAVASHVTTVAQRRLGDGPHDGGASVDWMETLQGPAISADSGDREARISLAHAGDGAPALVLDAQWVDRGGSSGSPRPRKRRWEWISDDGGETERLEDVVVKVLKGEV
ncbi:hypothetical protein DL766_003055 [Monosporascus sp. MC13-8B]|uniref:Mediator of RNA polymerase II transcription subunit 17 n=1 Tax=Monosporascus cannonballus TaxID=155416 RepID=A0ABY0H9N7_9PEZI|nr:hypothetical protein DL762_003762 [Monosporascus cannonballus]RYO96310.1 hypothetical protein DL763_003283 [Monosporascus cannonballus]RYP34280.1 hypothetical protein DL766_003055 [Monosporascus sp. MC13-8B]